MCLEERISGRYPAWEQMAHLEEGWAYRVLGLEGNYEN